MNNRDVYDVTIPLPKRIEETVQLIMLKSPQKTQYKRTCCFFFYLEI